MATPPNCQKWKHILAKEISIEVDFDVEDVEAVLEALVTVFTRRAKSLPVEEWLGIPGIVVFKKVMSPYRFERKQWVGSAKQYKVVPEAMPYTKLRPRVAKELFEAVTDSTSVEKS